MRLCPLFFLYAGRIFSRQTALGASEFARTQDLRGRGHVPARDCRLAGRQRGGSQPPRARPRDDRRCARLTSRITALRRIARRRCGNPVATPRGLERTEAGAVNEHPFGFGVGSRLVCRPVDAPLVSPLFVFFSSFRSSPRSDRSAGIAAQQGPYGAAARCPRLWQDDALLPASRRLDAQRHRGIDAAERAHV